MKIDSVYERARKLPENAGTLLLTFIPAVAAGFAAVGFLLGTNWLFARTFLRLASRPKPVFLAGSFLVIVTLSFVVSVMLRFGSSAAAGSGIPQLKADYWREMGDVRMKTVWIKFVSGVLSIGGGNSLGREGPSVFVGGGLAANVAGVLGVPRRERRPAVAAGGAAALAASFNTPIAAITFVIEEIIGDFNSRYLGRVVLAAVLGAFTVHAIVGRQPAFILPSVAGISWSHYLVVPFAAALASVGGLLFQRGALFLRGRLRGGGGGGGWRWLHPVAGGVLTWIVAIAAFEITGRIGVFGLGYQDLSAALAGKFPWEIAGLLFVAKLAATIFGYSFAGSGGIFAPSLFVGGMAGYFVAGVAGHWLPLTPSDHIVLAAVGMSACLGTIVRAPLTSLLIVFEMTHQFELVPGLLIAMLVSQAIAKGAGPLNFYDALLVQDGHPLHKIRPPVDIRGWHNLPVSAIVNPKPVALTEVSAKAAKALLDRYPYNGFPVIVGGKLEGIAVRAEMRQAVAAGRAPEVRPAVTCVLENTVREVGDKFLEAPVHMLVVIDEIDRGVRGIVTLHDLIRAQAAVEA